MAIPRNTEPELNSACQIRNGPELTVGRSGVRAEKLAWRVLMQFGADGLPLRWHELSSVAATTPIDQAWEAMRPVAVAPTQQTGATTTRNFLYLGHRVAGAVQPDGLEARAGRSILGP